MAFFGRTSAKEVCGHGFVQWLRLPAYFVFADDEVRLEYSAWLGITYQQEFAGIRQREVRTCTPPIEPKHLPS
jgi:hypothetical protein